MEQKIIEKLRSELNDTYWCKNDFEKYDIESFEGENEPFTLAQLHSMMTTLGQINEESSYSVNR